MINDLPLAGKKILVTRGGRKGEELASKIISKGGSSSIIPLIDFTVNNDQHAREYVQKLPSYDWIIFTSQNGVNYFFEECTRLNPNFCPSDIKNNVAAVGSKTKEAVEKYGVKVGFYPSQFSAADFIVEFLKKEHSTKHILIAKGNLASRTIADGLEEKKVLVDEWIVYRTFFPYKSRDKLVQLLVDRELDYATFTSPSTFHHFMEVVTSCSLQYALKNIEFIAIGAVTKKAIEQYGFSVAASPEVYTIDSMLDSLCQLAKLKEEKK